jgi:hypothetical protein
MNSLYAPADSLTPILHRPTTLGQGATTCTNCNEAIQFNTWSKRYENIATGVIRCKEAK